jgi:hypothetical protein
MMNRRNQVLSVLLAVQIVLGAVVFWPRWWVSGAEAGPLLAGFRADEVVSLSVTDSDENRVALVKESQGWVLPEVDDYPADGEKVSALLQKIEGLQANRQVTRTESSHKRLKVAEDDFERLIELEMADGAAYQLYVGSSPQANATHVRAADGPETYLTSELASYEVDATAGRWIDALYYTLPQTATVALSLKNANGEFQFERGADEEWLMKGLGEGEEFNQAGFNTLLGQASSLRMAEPIGREEEDWFGLDQAGAVVTLETEEGQAFSLRIGAKDAGERNNYVAKWSESPYYVWLPEYTASSFLDKTRDDFIVPPPTPAPETGSQPPDESTGNGS